ncbi:MAG: electron transfer flavoprotein subunit alpha/FixB family protein [Alphaproteobacteria bacterium]
MSDSGDRTRRDPHAERAARRAGRSAAAAPPSVAEAAPPAPSGRMRRDPRAERAARLSGAAPSQAAMTAAPSPPAEPRVRTRIVAEPAYHILVVPDLEDGRLSSHDRDVIGAARLLADTGGGAVVVCAFSGPDGPRDSFVDAGADRVMGFVAPEFGGYAPESRAAAVIAAMAALGARHVLFPDTATGGGDVGRRVAVRLKDRAAGNVQRVAGDELVRRGGGGRSDLALAPPKVLLIAAEAADPAVDERYEARAIDPAPFSVSARLTDRGLASTDPSLIALAEADFIVSGGNGVQDWDGFHRLATALGASEGGSRPVCDAGHLPRARQVGASGTLVEPRCYVALGIAGAPQHLQGIAKCERVVAVNADPHCDMIKRADLAIIGDVQALMPALERLAKGVRGDA